MRNKIGTMCMVLGAALVLAALSLFVWNQHEDQLAGESVDNILPQLTQCIPTQTESTEKETVSDPYDPTMTEVEIDGYAYIGYLSIPSIDVELPVLSEWDYKRLKIAPCRYAGSTKTDDLVVCAHNYTRHFRRLKRLSVGDTVVFTDMDGVTSTYRVTELDILGGTDVQQMTAGGYDLTLFTCTYDSRSRVTVRCNRINEE